MNTAYLILGTNKGDREQNLQQVLKLIQEKIGSIPHKSEIFVTAPWGNPDQADFYNQAVQILTVLNPKKLLQMALEIEAHMGRTRTTEKWMERTMDIDILFYNSEIIQEQDLQIPHPFIQDRKFVLIPLNEIAADFIHPIMHKSINQLLLQCTDSLGVSKKE